MASPPALTHTPMLSTSDFPRGGGLFASNETLTENPDNEKMYLKFSPSGKIEGGGITPVPWCRNAYYLSERPNFTLDPLLHAGVYYVQEAGSMFLDEVLRQVMPSILSKKSPLGSALDLCAAPGGKST